MRRGIYLQLRWITARREFVAVIVLYSAWMWQTSRTSITNYFLFDFLTAFSSVVDTNASMCVHYSPAVASRFIFELHTLPCCFRQQNINFCHTHAGATSVPFVLGRTIHTFYCSTSGAVNPKWTNHKLSCSEIALKSLLWPRTSVPFCGFILHILTFIETSSTHTLMSRRHKQKYVQIATKLHLKRMVRTSIEKSDLLISLVSQFASIEIVTYLFMYKKSALIPFKYVLIKMEKQNEEMATNKKCLDAHGAMSVLEIQYCRMRTWTQWKNEQKRKANKKSRYNTMETAFWFKMRKCTHRLDLSMFPPAIFNNIVFQERIRFSLSQCLVATHCYSKQ